jgi:hypothetical protein
MKRKVKVVAGVVAAVVAIAVLAGVFLLRPATPFEFLEGARLVDVQRNHGLPVRMFFSSPGLDMTVYEYELRKTPEQVADEAYEELEVGDWSWSVDHTWAMNDAERSMVSFDEIPTLVGNEAVVYVRFATPSVARDRVRAWLWGLTHK